MLVVDVICMLEVLAGVYSEAKEMIIQTFQIAAAFDGRGGVSLELSSRRFLTALTQCVIDFQLLWC